MAQRVMYVQEDTGLKNILKQQQQKTLRAARRALRLTCVFAKLFQELIPVPVFGDVAHKEPVVIVGYRHTQLFSFP
jgi:hypothetical protein